MASAGCGAAGGSLQAGSGSGQRQPLAFAACMRAHGVSDFPDPRDGGFSEEGGPTAVIVNGVALKEGRAQLETAHGAGQRHVMSSAWTTAPNPQLQRAADAYAACMRSDEFPNFPDPQVKPHAIQVAPPPGTQVGSPLFASAQRACRSLMAGAGGSRSGQAVAHAGDGADLRGAPSRFMVQPRVSRTGQAVAHVRGGRACAGGPGGSAPPDGRTSEHTPAWGYSAPNASIGPASR